MSRKTAMFFVIVFFGFVAVLAYGEGEKGSRAVRAAKSASLPKRMASGQRINFDEVTFLQERSFSAEDEGREIELQDETLLVLAKGTKLVVREFAPVKGKERSLDFVDLFSGKLTVHCGPKTSMVVEVPGGTLSADGGDHEITVLDKGWVAKSKTDALYVIDSETGMLWQQQPSQCVRAVWSGIGRLFTSEEEGEGKLVLTLPPPKQPRKKAKKEKADGGEAVDEAEAEPEAGDPEDVPLLIKLDPGETVYIERVGKSVGHWPWRPNRLWLPELVTVGGRELIYRDNIAGDRFLIYAYEVVPGPRPNVKRTRKGPKDEKTDGGQPLGDAGAEADAEGNREETIGDLELTLPGGRETALFWRSSLVFPAPTLPGLPTGALPMQERRYRRLHDFKNTGTGPRVSPIE